MSWVLACRPLALAYLIRHYDCNQGPFPGRDLSSHDGLVWCTVGLLQQGCAYSIHTAELWPGPCSYSSEVYICYTGAPGGSEALTLGTPLLRLGPETMWVVQPFLHPWCWLVGARHQRVTRSAHRRPM